MRYKCFTCHLILKEEDLINKNCPICGEPHVQKMCETDHICTCALDITPGINYCPKCGQPTCPCGSHDVSTISRVTGYLQAVEGWNSAKQQELKDRQRYTV